MVLNLVWDWYVLSPVSCPHCPQTRRVSLEMRQACWLPVGIESKWLLYQESSHACYTHVFMHMFTQCTHDNFKLQPFLWHGFCRSSTLLSSRAHMWWACLPSLVSSIHDVFAVTFLVLHIHSGCPLLTIFTNNGANSAYVWHFKHLNYQCYCNRWLTDYVFVNFSFFGARAFYGILVYEGGGGKQAKQAVWFITTVAGYLLAPSCNS